VIALSIDQGGQSVRTTARVLGSAGNDMLSLILTGVGDLGLVDARVDGGDGRDFALVSRGVGVDCERVVVV
jgi:hypothetical protein